MTAPAIECEGLVKSFGTKRAVDAVDLVVPRGSIFGFLGPNGAGKTTTIRILATLTRPDAGSARVLGHDVVAEAAEVRRRISLISQFATVDQDLTCTENLILSARLLGFSWGAARRRAAELLETFDLVDAANRQASALSGGMRRRLDIAAGLVTTPDLLFLDEPTTGLDPRNRRTLWDVVRRVADCGTSVVLTTQYLEEADQLADRIAVIDDGRIVAEGTRDELKASVGAGMLRVQIADVTERSRAIEALGRSLDTTPTEDAEAAAVTVRLAGDGSQLGRRAAAAVAELADAEIAVQSFAFGQPSMDDVFLALTGRPAATDEESVHDR